MRTACTSRLACQKLHDMRTACISLHSPSRQLHALRPEPTSAPTCSTLQTLRQLVQAHWRSPAKPSAVTLGSIRRPFHSAARSAAVSLRAPNSRQLHAALPEQKTPTPTRAALHINTLSGSKLALTQQAAPRCPPRCARRSTPGAPPAAHPSLPARCSCPPGTPPGQSRSCSARGTATAHPRQADMSTVSAPEKR